MIYKTIRRKNEPVRIVVEMSIDEADMIKCGLEILSPDSLKASVKAEFMSEFFGFALEDAMERSKEKRANIPKKRPTRVENASS